jgi:IPT/TIG domain
MADNDPKPNEGPGSQRVSAQFITLLGFIMIAATSALLYGLYVACPTCEPPENAASAAPTSTTNTPQPSPSQSPGVITSPTPVPELKLIALSPNSGSIMGGNLVRLEGVGLNNVKEVRFGGQPATTVGLPNPTLLTVKPSAHIEGRVDVVISDGQGRDNSANPAFYTYTCPPQGGRKMIWLMALVGAIGAILHVLRSFSWYVGNRDLVWSWIPTYFILPFVGALTSIAFYLIIRGGLMTAASESDNVFGLLAIGTLVGLFTQPALEKLKKISEGILTSAPTGKDSKPVEVERVAPPDGQENQPVTILGNGFVKGRVRVRFGDKVAKVAKVEDQEITVTTPENPPGNVKVVVIQDSASLEVPGGFTYKNTEPPPENKPDDNAGPPTENKQEDKDE